MNEFRAENWNHLQDLLFTGSWRDTSGASARRTRSVVCSVAALSSLTTSLQRLGGDTVTIEQPPAAQLPQVRLARRGSAGRLAVELAGAGPAPRPAHAAARLDLLALRGAALRHRRHRDAIERRRRRLVRRLRRGQPLAARAAARHPGARRVPNVFTVEMLAGSPRDAARVRPPGRRSLSRSSSSRRRSTRGSSTSSRSSR